MFHLFLPIANTSVNVIYLVALGLCTGLLSGVFGIGGGFIITPVMILMGINPVVAVGASVNQITASTASVFFHHFRQHRIKFKIGILMLFGSIPGTLVGILLVNMLNYFGISHLVINLSYIALLSFIGFPMLIGRLLNIKKKKKSRIKMSTKQLKQKDNLDSDQSNLSLDSNQDTLKFKLTAISIGLIAGTFISFLGIGGGLITVPAMLYILKMESQTIIGTTSLLVLISSIVSTMLQSYVNHSIDIVLSFILIIPAIIGAKIGIKISNRLNTGNLKIFLAILILIVDFMIVYGLTKTPTNLFNINI